MNTLSTQTPNMSDCILYSPIAMWNIESRENEAEEEGEEEKRERNHNIFDITNSVGQNPDVESIKTWL